MRALRMIVVAGALYAAPLQARADTAKAWTTARDNLPASASIVVGADLTAITRSALFGTLFPLALSQQADVKRGFDFVKATCNIDPLTAIHGVVVALDHDKKQGAMYFSLGGVDQPKLMRCVEEIAKARGTKDATIKATKAGAITELAIGDDKVYVTWFGSDVIAIGLDARDKAQLQKWTGQKGALRNATIGKTLANVDTRAALWGATTVGKTIEPGVDMTHGYGAVTVANGNLATDLHLGLDSAKAASDTAARTNAKLQTAAATMPPKQQALLKGLTVSSAGAEVIVKASIAESDVLMLIGSFLRP